MNETQGATFCCSMLSISLHYYLNNYELYALQNDDERPPLTFNEQLSCTRHTFLLYSYLYNKRTLEIPALSMMLE